MQRYEQITQINKKYFNNHNSTTFTFNLSVSYNYDILNPEEIKLALKHCELRIEKLKKIHEVIDIYKNMNIPLKYVKRNYYKDSHFNQIYLNYNPNELIIDYPYFEPIAEITELENKATLFQRLFKTKSNDEQKYTEIKKCVDSDSFEVNYNILLNKYIDKKKTLENEIKWLEEKLNDEIVEYANPPLFDEKSLYKTIGNHKFINVPSYNEFNKETSIEKFKETLKNNKIIHEYLKECKKVNTVIKWSIGENQGIEIYKDYIHIILNESIMHSLVINNSKASNTATFISFIVYNDAIINRRMDEKNDIGLDYRKFKHRR